MIQKEYQKSLEEEARNSKDRRNKSDIEQAKKKAAKIRE